MALTAGTDTAHCGMALTAGTDTAHCGMALTAGTDTAHCGMASMCGLLDSSYPKYTYVAHCIVSGRFGT
jgi:hypothetical protein